MYQFKLERFEGPLALLLCLIEEQKLEITKISLAQVTEQYLDYLNSNHTIPLAELADFLVIASKLILIKSKKLLPFLDAEIENEASELEQQLKIYKEYLEASLGLQKLIHKKNFLYVKGILPAVIAFRPPLKLAPDDLTRAYKQLLEKIEPIIHLPQQLIKTTVSIKEKIEQIRNLIARKVTIEFSGLLKNNADKTEAIVSFLALLELIKQKILCVQQNQLFKEIQIRKIEDL